MPENKHSYKNILDDDIIKLDSKYDINLPREVFINTLSRSIIGYFESPINYEGNVFLVDGAWGSGKSWVLKITKQWLDSPESSAGIDFTWREYSAWQYFDEKDLFFDFWQTLQADSFEIPLIGKIKKEKQVETIEKLKSKWESFNKILNSVGEVGAKGLEKMDWLIETTEKVTGVCQVFVPGMGVIHQGLQLAKQFKKNSEKETSKIEKLIEKVAQLGEMQAKQDEFYSQKDKFKDFTPNKTVVILEDLDRIHEDKLWRIFMLISLFENQENILFVLVGSSNYLQQIINKKYHISEEGENFLAKFISVRFALPAPDFKLILKERFLKKPGISLEKGYIIDETILKYCLKNLVNARSFRELKLNYIEVFTKIFDSELMNLQEIERTSLIVWTFLLINIKLNQKHLWEMILSVKNFEQEIFKDQVLIFIKSKDKEQPGDFNTVDSLDLVFDKTFADLVHLFYFTDPRTMKNDTPFLIKGNVRNRSSLARKFQILLEELRSKDFFKGMIYFYEPNKTLKELIDSISM